AGVCFRLFGAAIRRGEELGDDRRAGLEELLSAWNRVRGRLSSACVLPFLNDERHVALLTYFPLDMASVNVRDLVGEHAGKLRLVVHERERAAGDEDIAAGRGHGVDDFGIKDGEV